VLDTNVLVSGILNPGGNPARVLALVFSGKLCPLFNAAIMAEYRAVLARPKFAFEPASVATLLEYIETEGEAIGAEPCADHFVDEDDRVFFEVCLCGDANALITGNRGHFPVHPKVMNPSEFLQHWLNAGVLRSPAKPEP